MKSIKDIYKIGKGPSSSHTMGPAKAMGIFVSENPDADSYEVVLYGSRKISLDLVIKTMYETGEDISHLYRETSGGGLAKLYNVKENKSGEK